jgi:hypothetical protein
MSKQTTTKSEIKKAKKVNGNLSIEKYPKIGLYMSIDNEEQILVSSYEGLSINIRLDADKGPITIVDEENNRKVILECKTIK